MDQSYCSALCGNFADVSPTLHVSLQSVWHSVLKALVLFFSHSALKVQLLIRMHASTLTCCSVSDLRPIVRKIKYQVSTSCTHLNCFSFLQVLGAAGLHSEAP